MTAIVTVVGADRIGINAFVCTLLAEKNANILDISQTVMDGNFTMVMSVDLAGCTEPISELGHALKTRGAEQGLEIRIAREEIFDAMHRI